MTPDMQQALTECRHLIETRAEAVMDIALNTQEPWTTALREIPADGRERQQWRRRARAEVSRPRFDGGSDDTEGSLSWDRRSTPMSCASEPRG